MSTIFDDPDRPISAEELTEAAALARALEHGREGTSPELEGASLLRHARRAEVPDVLDRLLPTLPYRRRRRWWLLPAVLVPLAAGLLMMGVGLRSYRFAEPTPGAESLQPPRALWPSAELLAAQSRAARGDRAALAALEAEMRLYRAIAFGEGRRSR
jgi:hypothetical protein